MSLSNRQHILRGPRGRKSLRLWAVPKSARSGQPRSGEDGSSFQRMLAGFTSPGTAKLPGGMHFDVLDCRGAH
eukprot:15456053-Alexandrium_andersonii.AAC.1